MVQRRNIIGTILLCIGLFIFVIGFLMSMITGSFDLILSSFILGMLFIGGGEALQLLHNLLIEMRISNGTEMEEKVTQVSEESSNFYTIHPLKEAEKEQVYPLYNEYKKREITIVATPFPQYCIVTLPQKVDVVHVEDDGARKLSEDEVAAMPELITWAKAKKGINLS